MTDAMACGLRGLPQLKPMFSNVEGTFMSDAAELLKLQRNELFEMVWREPLSKIASRLGISGVGLAKACKRHNIPVPPRGYWAKLQHGKRVWRIPALPPAPDGKDEVRIQPPTRIEAPTDLPNDIALLVNDLGSESTSLTVPSNPSKLHPVIAAWEADAKKARAASFLAPTPRVSPTERRRRRFLSQLFKEIDKRKGSAQDENHAKFVVTIAGEKLQIACTESTKRETIPEDQRKSSWDRYQYLDTGELSIRIENYFKEPVRRRWRDRKELPLEAQLRDVLIGLVMAAAVERRERLKREEEHRRYMEAEHRRLEFEERKRRIDVHLKELTSDADSWAKACRMREFVNASVSAQKERTHDADELAAWEAWARLAADAIDPLVTNADGRVFYAADLPANLRRKDEANRWRY